jgi:hypothetical protein
MRQGAVPERQNDVQPSQAQLIIFTIVDSRTQAINPTERAAARQYNLAATTSNMRRRLFAPDAIAR